MQSNYDAISVHCNPSGSAQLGSDNGLDKNVDNMLDKTFRESREVLKCSFNGIASELKAMILGYVVDEAGYVNSIQGMETLNNMAEYELATKPSVFHFHVTSKKNANLNCFMQESEYKEQWRLNEGGIIVGRPIARFALQKILELDISLGSIFGRAIGSSTYNSAFILYYLLQNPKCNNAAIAEASSLCATSVLSKLRQWEHSGLVKYDSFKSEAGDTINYCFAVSSGEEHDGQEHENGKLKFTHPEVARTIIESKGKLPNEFSHREVKTIKDYNSLIIRSTLGDLVGKGILEKPKPWKGRKFYSTSSLTSKGTQVVRELIIPIVQYVSGNEDYREAIKHNALCKERISEVVKLYIDNKSRRRNRR